MDEGYDFSDPNPEDELSDLDEYVTEYVDGTMDPAVREAFEEYLEANPHLLEYVCCLSDVRCALQDLNCSCRAPSGVQARLRRRVSGDMVADESRSGVFRTGRSVAPLAVAATALLLVSVGTIWITRTGGETVSGGQVAEQTAAAAESETADRAETPSPLDAPATRAAAGAASLAGSAGESTPARSGGALARAEPTSAYFGTTRSSGLDFFTRSERTQSDRMTHRTGADARQGPPVDAPSFRPPSRLPAGLDNAMVRQSEAAPNAQLLVQFE